MPITRTDIEPHLHKRVRLEVVEAQRVNFGSFYQIRTVYGTVRQVEDDYCVLQDVTHIDLQAPRLTGEPSWRCGSGPFYYSNFESVKPDGDADDKTVCPP